MFDTLREALIPGTKVPLDAVPLRGGIVLPDAPYVVTQPAHGEYCAFRKHCPHAGRPVDEVIEGAIRCAAHGSTFDPRTGEPLTGPATGSLARASIRQVDDRLVITR